MRGGESGKGWPWLSNVDFEAKFTEQSLALSDEDKMTSEESS